MHRLKRDFPEHAIVINGGVATPADIARELFEVDGVMLGRAAYHHPYVLADADALCFGPHCRGLVRCQAPPYVEAQLGAACTCVRSPDTSWASRSPGARTWRRTLSDAALLHDGGPELLLKALREVEPESVAASV